MPLNLNKLRQEKSTRKLELNDLPVSTRKYPYVHFKPNREAGKDMLKVEGLTKTIDGEKILDNLNFEIRKGDKVIFLGR